MRRVLSTEPPTVEVSFEDTGKMPGVTTSGFGTYKSTVRPDGTIFGDGEGVMMTPEGEMIAWKGSGLGRFGERGAVSYRGMIFFRTTAAKLTRLNGVGGAFEFDVDPDGNIQSKIWEWK